MNEEIKKLGKKDIEDIMALTPMQEGMLFHYLKDTGGDYYVEQLSLEISGEIDKEIFEKAWNFVIEINEMLRAVFRWEKVENPIQIILKQHKIHPRYFDFSNAAVSEAKKRLEEVKVNDRKRKFDLREVPFRVTLCKVEEDKYEMIISNYHILYDGWSNGIILKEFFNICKDLFAGKEPIKPVKAKFKEFVKWMQNQDKARQETYWREYLKDFYIPTSLPIKKKDVDININDSDEIHRYRYQFPGEFVARIGAFIKGREITLAALLYSAWSILLQKYINTWDVVFGTTVSGRNAKVNDVENIVGLFINTVPLRVQREALITVWDLLDQVHCSLQKREEYETTSLVDIKKNSEVEGKESLFDTILVIENYPLDRILTGMNTNTNMSNPFPFSINAYFMFYMTNYDLTVAIDTFNDIGITFTYLEEIFDDSAVERLMGHFHQVLQQMVRGSNKTIHEIDILTPSEKRQLLEEFNCFTREYPLNKTIHQFFEEQVERTPARIAVEAPHELYKKGTKGLAPLPTLMSITYGELNKKSNQLAGLLRNNSVFTETVVGIMMEPGIDLIVCLLAILKAGGAYLPIDPGFPVERICFMLENAGVPTLLTNSQTVENLSFTALQNFEENHHLPLTVTPPRGHIKGFNDLPMADRSLINLGNYKNKIGMASVTDNISLQTTRGCPFECLYCHKLWSKNHVFRSAENIINEIEYYYQRGVANFACIDDCFNLNMKNSSRLFRMILRDKLKVQLFFPNGLRGDIMTPDYIDLMIEAGTRGINLSLETASPRLQKLLKKNLDLDKFKNVVDYIAEQHPEVMLEMAAMHGFPTETEEEAMMTLNFIKDIKWLHFPYIHILKIFPNTEMEEFALAHGIKKEDIMRSRDRAFHELPETLPFPKNFTRKYQSDFMNNYFLSRERLERVLPVQMKILSEAALAQKYNAYLPVEIKGLKDIIQFARLEDMEQPLPGEQENLNTSVNIFDEAPRERQAIPGTMRILLLDLSQHFSSHHMLYKVAEQPLGLIYLLTYLKEKFNKRVDGRIYKAGNDFDSFEELKALVDDYKPHLVGIRTLTFFKEFFHETVSLLRQWGIDVPIITGGPYASSDYRTILKDKNIDLVAFGEGEETLADLIERMLENDFKLPDENVLRSIKGIAFVSGSPRVDKSRTVLLPDRLADQPVQEPPGNLEPVSSANHLAYVMYTSGSTGVPKGVTVEHCQVINCLQWMQDKFQLGETDTVVQRTDITFDPSVWEIFWPLSVGGKVKLLSTQERKDPEYLIRLMAAARDEGLTIMYCPSSLVKALTWVLNSRTEKPRLTMPWLIIGAESIKMEVVKNFYAYYEGRIVNTYGPTECTINNTWYDLEPNDQCSVVPIGKPVANNKIFILSKDWQPMPINAAGEICIAGDSVGRGYLDKPELTNKKFLWGDVRKALCAMPFSPGRRRHPSARGPYKKIYKTGDIGRWFEDGTIEIMGRVDQQVKIRGYRIELGEIEKSVLSHSAVDDCVVVVRDSKESKAELKTCKTCGITSRYPGANINDDELCEICMNFQQLKKSIDAYFKTPADLEMLIKEKNKSKNSKYDCILLYAGGRGSAYALYQLKDMGFKVLAVTYDNGYFSRADIRNIKKITASVGVDHVVLNHKNSDQILKESLKTVHTVCRGCFHTSSSLAAEYVYRNNINVVVGATLSRGQIIENKLYLFLKQGIEDVETLEAEVTKLQISGPAMDKSIFTYIDIDCVIDGSVHEKVTVVDFYRYFDITNEEMMAYLDNRDPYWKTRRTYAIYSTNCPIKQVGDYAHLQERGFHFYGSATSWEKRLGHLSLENLKEDLTCRVSANGYGNFLKRIFYQPEIPIKNDDKYICAYILSKKKFSVSELREYLESRIPGYMIPSYFVPIKSIPLTSVGKVDQRALPLPDRSRSRLKSTYVTPQSKLEKTVAQVWQEVLKVDKVGLDDNFFDLGGDSLVIVQLSERLKRVLSREVPVVMIFTYPTVGLLARNLKQDKENEMMEVSAEKEGQGRRYQEREKGKNRLKQRLRKNVRI